MSIELLKLENAIEEYRKLQIAGKYATELQPQAMCALLMIARGHFQAEEARDERAKNQCYVTVTEIQDQLRLSSASASRNIASLTWKGGRPVTIKGVVQRDENGKPIWGSKQNPNGLGLVLSERNDLAGYQNQTVLKLTDAGVIFVRKLEQIMRISNPEALEDRRIVPSVVTDARTEVDKDGNPIREDEKQRDRIRMRQKMANQARAQGVSIFEQQQIMGLHDSDRFNDDEPQTS
tara:strand:+ start:178 stop:882 length:705 start_codon:yes stop_codon:yes gene_type:complete